MGDNLTWIINRTFQLQEHLDHITCKLIKSLEWGKLIKIYTAKEAMEEEFYKALHGINKLGCSDK